ncbi:eukaryotic translation initiation factor 3 subunit J-A-like isoform X4 [Zingiber officinale]|uniref:eukaryotic translation initiation factor 3 subunit J-A-like isoform X4 n=1 Tax=Zingiber officinale TaxID=94328 RepID=UPI001C4DC805|nr:eukaryotic translation initiation factor 3 subunit J-A-like isoform X4 [Zingiber officinale]
MRIWKMIILKNPGKMRKILWRLVEEADNRSTAELFAKKGDQKTLDDFIPKSENDFLEYAELLSYKIHPYEKSFHYIGLLISVLRLSMTSLKAADAKEIAASASAIANEKLKAEKEANAGKKKQGAKKKQLQVDKADDDYNTTGGYDDVDDYDFIISWLIAVLAQHTVLNHERRSTAGHQKDLSWLERRLVSPDFVGFF